MKLLLTPTLTIALLGAIESLLCARVADQLTTLPRHDPNQELMAQGIENFVTPFFGGMPATGTILLLRGGTLRLENLQAPPREVIERSAFGAELAAHRASPEVSL